MNTRHLEAAILNAATILARRKGIAHITQGEVAKAADAAEGTIHYHFGSMSALRAAVIEHAVKHEDLILIAQGLAHKYPATRRIPQDLKRRAALCLA